MGGGLAARQGQPSTVAEGLSLVVLVHSQPVALSWGQIKFFGNEPVRDHTSVTDTVLYLGRVEKTPSATRACQPKL